MATLIGINVQNASYFFTNAVLSEHRHWVLCCTLPAGRMPVTDDSGLIKQEEEACLASVFCWSHPDLLIWLSVFDACTNMVLR